MRWGAGTRPALLARSSSFASSPYSTRQSARRAALLAELARRVRSEPTPTKAKLWAYLHAEHLGVRFRRQVVRCPHRRLRLSQSAAHRGSGRPLPHARRAASSWRAARRLARFSRLRCRALHRSGSGAARRSGLARGLRPTFLLSHDVQLVAPMRYRKRLIHFSLKHESRNSHRC